jgi:hypothetical protein
MASRYQASPTGFTLQDPHFAPADTAMGRGLTFHAPALEDDFVRFRGRDRGVMIAAYLVAFPVVVVARILFTPQTELQMLFLLAGIAAALAAIPVYVVFVACARRPAEDSAAREVALALRQERFLLLYVYATFLPQLGEWLFRHRDCLGEPNRAVACDLGFLGLSIVVMVLHHIFVKPLLRSLVVVDAITVGGTLVIMGAFSENFVATDYVVVAAVMLVAAGVFMCDSYVRQRAERRGFVEHATLIKASLDIERLSEGTRAIVAAAMPKQLEELGASPVSAGHHSSDACVAICDIADFANWSCSLLIEAVVAALHDLVLLVDVSAALHDVVNVMSYGDSNVVCAGLISACHDPADRVRSFGERVLERSTVLPFRPRLSTCSGELVGSLVGESCKRYIIAGPAFTAAKAALAGVAGGTMAACDVSGAVGPREASIVESDNSIARQSGTATSCAAAAPEFSNGWLSFDDDATQGRFHAFAARDFEESKTLLSMIPVAVFAVYLLALLLELANEDRRRHSRPWGLVGVAVAIALGGAVAALRRFTAMPFAVDVALNAVMNLVGTVAVEWAGARQADGPAARLMTLLGSPNLFLQLPWLGQVAFIVSTVGAPRLAFALLRDTSFIADLGVQLTLVVLLKYHGTRVACQQYVADMAAQLAMDAARRETARHDQLLAGLLPPHAVPLAAVQDFGVHLRRRWASVSVLQLQLVVTELHHVAGLSQAWCGVASAVSTMPRRLLEVVETSGDSFLVAGPFIERCPCEVRQEAAVEVLRLLAALKKITVAHCPFTAVATNGSAYGALIGASGLTFRFFGAAVRESNAILAAAPNTTGAAVAFATAGFRQQHANFGVSARPPRTASKSARQTARRGSASMSLAVAAESTQQDTHAAVSVATAHFGAATNWRIRGAGVARVSAVCI